MHKLVVIGSLLLAGVAVSAPASARERPRASFGEVSPERAELGREGGQTPQTMTITSPTIKAGETIPADHTADGKNVSPALMWSNVPAGTKEFALIMDDPDVPMPQPFVHWVIYKIPGTAKGLPENIPIDAATPMPNEVAGAVQGMSGFRRPIYRGPAPPPGKPHNYHFTVYALDTALELAPGATKAQLLEAMKGHIIGQGQLVAVYERK